MTIYLVDGKPYFSVSNGFHPIDALTYHQMIENGEIDHMEVINHD